MGSKTFAILKPDGTTLSSATTSASSYTNKTLPVAGSYTLLFGSATGSPPSH